MPHERLNECCKALDPPLVIVNYSHRLHNIQKIMLIGRKFWDLPVFAYNICSSTLHIIAPAHTNLNHKNSTILQAAVLKLYPLGASITWGCDDCDTKTCNACDGGYILFGGLYWCWLMTMVVVLREVTVVLLPAQFYVCSYIVSFSHIWCPTNRAPLYQMLNGDGGNNTYTFVGSQVSGPDSMPLIDRHHEGHPGWRIDQMYLFLKKFIIMCFFFLMSNQALILSQGGGHNISLM